MLDRLVRFADTRGCRRHNLLRYFGDADAPRGCEACESCKGTRAPEAEAIAEVPRARKATPAPTEEGPYDEEVFEKLRSLRAELARETRVPPYVVFHDATLRELARALPRDEKSFLSVKGAGPGRWQRYGERVIAITGAADPADLGVSPAAVEPSAAEQTAAAGSQAQAPLEVVAAVATLDAPVPDSTPVVREAEEQERFPFGDERAAPPWRPSAPASPGLARRTQSGELWRLCASGATLAEICLQLRRSVPDVASEIANGTLEGKSVDVARLLGAERVEAIRAAARGSNGDVVAVRRRLPFPAALAEIRLAITASP